MKRPARAFPAIISFFLLLLMLPGSTPAYPFEGPLQVRNLFPLFIPAAQPYLEQATPQDSYSINLSHASVYMVRESGDWISNMDFEITELNLRFRKNFPGLLEAGIDIPLLRATAGFLDRPLAWYHRAFNFPDYGRGKRPQNEFLYDIQREGLPIFEADNDNTGFGDVRLTVKKLIFDADPAISILANVDLPTGDARIGYGNGSFDAGIAILFDKQFTENSKIYADAGAVFPGDLQALQKIKLKNFYYAGAAVEYFAYPDVSLLVQCLAQTSPFPHTGISKIDNTALLLAVGGRWHLGSGSYELSLTEDLSTAGVPDFILNLSFKRMFR